MLDILLFDARMIEATPRRSATAVHGHGVIERGLMELLISGNKVPKGVVDHPFLLCGNTFGEHTNGLCVVQNNTKRNGVNDKKGEGNG